MNKTHRHPGQKGFGMDMCNEPPYSFELEKDEFILEDVK